MLKNYAGDNLFCFYLSVRPSLAAKEGLVH
jgi:hypothetical protein